MKGRIFFKSHACFFFGSGKVRFGALKQDITAYKCLFLDKKDKLPSAYPVFLKSYQYSEVKFSIPSSDLNLKLLSVSIY
jgi:hypothetical protein